MLKGFPTELPNIKKSSSALIKLEAANCFAIFKCSVIIPYHVGGPTSYIYFVNLNYYIQSWDKVIETYVTRAH